MSSQSNIRTLRIAVLNVINKGFGITVLVDDHRPEDLLLILCLALLTVPMVRGRQTHLKKDRLLDDVCPSAIGAVLFLPQSLFVGPKAVIVTSGVQARVVQVQKKTADPATAISIAENGSIEIGRLHLMMIVNDENAKKGRERKTRR